MRTREKLVFLLIGGTLLLGALIFFTLQGNETEANYLRWLLADKVNRGLSQPGGFVAEELPSGTLFYGGLSVFAIIMTIVVLKMIRDGEIQALRRHLRELRQEKHEAESALQEQVWKGKSERQAKDSVMRDLESSIEKIETLLSELNEKELELKTRDAELMALKNSAVEEAAVAYAPGADRRLREELKRRNEILQAKDGALREMEQRFAAKTRLWENQLREKDGALKEREGELESIRLEKSDLDGRVEQLESARKRAEDRLEQELRQKREVLETEALARQAEEHRLNEAIRALEVQLSDRDKTLRQRDLDLGAVRRQLADLESARAQADQQIVQMSATAEDDRREGERALQDLERRMALRVHELQEEIGRRDLLLQNRDDELQSAQSELKAAAARLSEVTTAKARAEEAHQLELQKIRQEEESGILEFRQREDRHHTEIGGLKARLSEQEDFLKRRDQEVQSLQQRMHDLQRQVEESSAARQHSEASLREALTEHERRNQASDSALQDWERRYSNDIKALKAQLGERIEALRGRDEENRQLKTQVASLAQQVAKVGSAKEQAAQLLQQSLKKEQAALRASDSAVREMEEGFKARIAELEGKVAEHQKLVGNREAELTSARSELAAASQRMADLATAKERADQLLEDAMRQQKGALEAKELSTKQLETELTGRLWELETRLQEKEELLHRREAEIHGFKNQLADLESTKESSASLLHQELKQKSDLLRAKEADLNSLEERFKTSIGELESELQAKQEILAAREGEIKSLLVKLSTQSEQLVGIETSKENASRALEQDLRRAHELAQAKDNALKTLEGRLTSRLQSLEGQLNEKHELLATRDSEVDALMAKISELTQNLAEIGTDRERSERMLQEELREKTALLQSNESSIRELEEQFNSRIESLQRQLAEKQKLLESSGSELGELRAALNEQAERLNDADAAQVKLEGILEEERNRSEKAIMIIPSQGENGEPLEDRPDRGMDTLLSEREELLKARDKLIQNLMTELKEKRTQLARQEIEEWKGIERREAWKHRLAKVGIRLKG